MREVFGEDKLGQLATALFQSALQPRTYENYGSNLRSFLKFCEETILDPLGATLVDVARYVAWLGLRGTVAADSLQPYLSAVNRFLTDYALPPVAMGHLVSNVRKGLANSQADLAPLPERLALPAQVVMDVLRLAKRLLDMWLNRADP